jgi:formylglycine-generating enzyme required for sulfatase activity
LKTSPGILTFHRCDPDNIKLFEKSVLRNEAKMKRKMFLSVITVLMIVASIVGVRLDAGDKPFTSPAIGAQFVLIVPDTFMAGDEQSASRHQVTISKPFYIQTTEVTQGQWKKVMGDNPSSFKDCGDDCPVENVSWLMAQGFIRKLNQTEGTNKYRLPTEAEWEYVCRAGTTTKYSFGNGVEELPDYAWYNINSANRTHPVAQKKPNSWGLYDMHGNVWEWCMDWHDDYPSGAVTDPRGPSSSQHRVMRGGSWPNNPATLTSAFRGQDYPVIQSSDIGFRLVRDF